MALSVTRFIDPPGPISFGSMWMQVRKIAFDASYDTGGELLTKEQLGFSKAPDWVEIVAKGGYLFEYDAATEKVKVYRFDYDAVADGAAIEVTAAVNLSAVTDVLVKAYGRWAA